MDYEQHRRETSANTDGRSLQVGRDAPSDGSPAELALGAGGPPTGERATYVPERPRYGGHWRALGNQPRASELDSRRRLTCPVRSRNEQVTRLGGLVLANAVLTTTVEAWG